MSLAEVVNEVQRDAQARSQEIVAAARKEAESLLAAAREKAQAQERARSADAERDRQQLLLQARSRATSESRKVVLQAEAELRERLRGAVLDALAALPAPQRAAHVERLVARAQTIVPDGQVFGNSKDRKALESTGYTYGGEADIVGGIIVEAQDGQTRLDLSYETLLDAMWRDVLRSEAALFA